MLAGNGILYLTAYIRLSHWFIPFTGENDSPVAPLILAVALSVKLLGLIGGISCSQSLRAGAPDSLPNVIDPSALRRD
jgi:hypothetical protein